MRTASTDKDVINDIPEKLVVITKGMRASSPIYDYIYRPIKYTNMSLYDWVQQLQKVKGGTQQINKTSKEVKTPDVCDDQDEIDDVCDDQDEIDTDLQELQIGGKRKRDEEEGQDILVDYSEMFIEGHPQRQTHQPHLLIFDEYTNRVPNFLGGPLPRRDKGRCLKYMRLQCLHYSNHGETEWI